jgi:hypothetical protein
MNRPSINFIAQSFIPSTSYSFALLWQDYRLLFAINCASRSNLSFIPVFCPERLQEQLDLIVKMSVQRQVTLSAQGTLTLPPICQWYTKDFEYCNNMPIAGGSGVKLMLQVLCEMLDSAAASQLKDVLSNSGGTAGSGVTVKYSSFDFKCIMLMKLPEDVHI